jgi:hypothetical protein
VSAWIPAAARRRSMSAPGAAKKKPVCAARSRACHRQELGFIKSGGMRVPKEGCSS